MMTNSLNPDRPIFIQRQSIQPLTKLATLPKQEFLKSFFSSPKSSEGPFSPLTFVGNEISGMTDRSYGAATTVDGTIIRNKQRETLSVPGNTMEDGDSAVSVSLVVDKALYEKYKDTLFGEISKKGEDSISGGAHFTINKLDFSKLGDEELKLLTDYMVISVGNKDGQDPLDIRWIGEKASGPLQDYMKDEIKKLSSEKESNSSKVLLTRNKDELLKVWAYLKQEGRTSESREGMVPLNPTAVDQKG